MIGLHWNEVFILSLLETIHSPEDLRGFTDDELNILAREIRGFLVDTVSVTGGHLSSNLGGVELSIAIHRVYDTARDRLVFDVGHQSYVHKILTGRREEFHTLRKAGGISGFPRPEESVHDAFIAGHASNSISVALGMARARTLQKEDYDVLALIGDGALTGGLAYEGLSNAGQSGEPLVIILNDNGMSINRSVGGIARLLARQRIRPAYLNFKRWYRRTIGPLRPVYRFFHHVKESIKDLFLPSGMFEELGFEYVGPVDGHDIRRMETALYWAKELRRPVVVHVITEKGKGYDKAEREPGLYHGVSPFDPNVGVIRGEGKDFSAAFGARLCTLAAGDEKICAITAAMADGTGLTGFASRFPERFNDVGIAEGHAVSLAAGMAKQGLRPVLAVYSSFLQRGYDMLIHDIALQRLHVVLAVDRAGLVGHDGEAHHGLFDVAYLTSVPYMAVLCPASYAELREMLEYAIYRISGPVAVRYPRGGEGAYKGSHAGTAMSILRDGHDIAVVSYGTLINEVLLAAERLAECGVSVRVVKLNVINPLDEEALIRALADIDFLLVAEEASARGSVGERILSVLARRGRTVRGCVLCNLGTGIVGCGSVSELYKQCGLDAVSLALAAENLLKEHLSEEHEKSQT